MKSKKTNQKDEIEPPQGWIIQSVYGFLKDARGNRLVRLEDVHAWLMTNKEQSSASAAAWMFSAFNSDAGSPLGMLHGAAAVRTTLRILHPAENAAEYGDYSGRLFFKELDAHFPYLPHHRFDRDSEGALIYAMGIAAGHLWAPAMRDCNEADLNELLGDYGPEGDFPSCAICRNLLGRLAVSFQAAHKLWDWGRIAKPATVTELHLVPMTPAPTAMPAMPATPKKVPQKLLAPDWTGEKLGRRRAEIVALNAKTGRRDHAKQLAKESGLPVREIVRRILDDKPTKRIDQRLNAGRK